VVSGIASNLSLYGLRLNLSLPAGVHVGQTAAVLVSLTNEKAVVPSLTISLRVPGMDGQASGSGGGEGLHKLFPFIPAGATRTEKIEMRLTRRGVYPLQGFQIHTRFPFGFVSRGRELPVDGRVTVYPELVEVRGLIRDHPFLAGTEIGIRRGSGVGLYNVRDYRWGDSARYVHWKATAKLSKLMVKEFLDEQDSAFQLVLSTYLPVKGPESEAKFERVLSWVASLACRYQGEGRTFSFYSGEYESTVRGDRESLTDLLEYLAWVGPADRLLLEEDRIGPGAVLLVAGNVLPGCERPRIDYLSA
jgi:uncharacterized protein (DUF58 family)